MWKKSTQKTFRESTLPRRAGGAELLQILSTSRREGNVQRDKEKKKQQKKKKKE